jgi:hypothetical protein
MPVEEKINIDIYKVVFRAIAESDNLEIMANHLTQLLVAALEIKGCTLFALDPEKQELEILASFGLSMKYLNKGPLLTGKSIGAILKKEPIVIRDVKTMMPRMKASAPSYPFQSFLIIKLSEPYGCITIMPGKFRRKISTRCWSWPKTSDWP